MKHEVVWLPISEPVPYESNAKTHPIDQIDRLCKMILKGFDQPLVLDKDKVLIKGHGRLLAAKKLGMKEVPCVIRADLTEDEVVAHRLGDNKNAESPWDMAFAIPELNHLYDSGFDMDVSGFFDWKPTPIDEPLVPQCDEDEVPEAPEPIATRGDVWKLGRHRLMCGDSSNPVDADALMNGDKADLFFTDPPYGVSYASKNQMLNKLPNSGGAFTRGNRIERAIENDSLCAADLKDLLAAAFAVGASHTTEKASYYVTYAEVDDVGLVLRQALLDAGWQLKHMLIWVKNLHVLGRCDYHYRHEPILYGWKQKGTHEFFGGSDSFTVWEFPLPQKSDLHPTMKPVELIERAVTNSCPEKGRVLDLFGGSGSTLIACEKTNRTCFMMELDPHYCDVIRERWEKFTGKKAEIVHD